MTNLETIWLNPRSYSDEAKAVANDNAEANYYAQLGFAALIGFAVGVGPGLLFFLITAFAR